MQSPASKGVFETIHLAESGTTFHQHGKAGHGTDPAKGSVAGLEAVSTEVVDWKKVVP